MNVGLSPALKSNFTLLTSIVSIIFIVTGLNELIASIKQVFPSFPTTNKPGENSFSFPLILSLTSFENLKPC